jgi:hypothetical protein
LRYPYSQALNPGKYVLPVYDDAATIYSTYTFKCCNSKLTDSGFGASEFMLETQLGKVCNSLKLRMGIRIADVTECLLHHKQQLTAISGGYSL